ncbi:MAG TPA: lipid-binding SYLF domain-containing protein [Phycisphaerae bacterium]|nr:lipid-binding SYLF domain-containing protein [Phycisphaerae bacterium]
MKRFPSAMLALTLAVFTPGCASFTHEHGELGGALADDSKAALAQLRSKSPAAEALARSAKAVLVFPVVYKAGFIVGAFSGDGALIDEGKVVDFYNTSGGSYGLQAGAQGYAYALFFMNDKSLDYLEHSAGWEIGVGPTVTVVDQGLAASLTTTTARDDVYCFFFNQKGLMAGLGLQGSKITPISR